MDPVTMAAIIGGGSSILGGILGNRSNAKQADKAMAFENSQAERQMAFQREMATTEYQRAVEDMRKAGINPILAAKGGNSSPSGAAGSGSTAHMENVLEPVNAALKQKYEMQLTKEMVATERTKQELNSANAKAAAGYVGVPGFAKVSLGQAKEWVQKNLKIPAHPNEVRRAWRDLNHAAAARARVNSQMRSTARPMPPLLPQPV